MSPSPSERIVSLFPAATELLFVLDAWDQVVGVSHECDFPPEAKRMPKLTRSRIDPGRSPKQIDDEVKRLAKAGESLYEVDAQGLDVLAPDIIIAQTICDVCAITPKEIERATRGLAKKPEVMQLGATTFDGVLETFRTVANRIGRRDAMRRELLKQWSLAKQIRGMTKGRRKVRVAILDWVEPLMFAGHWTADLCQIAGVEYTLVPKGEKSRWGSWEELDESEPDVIIAAPCGESVERGASELAAAIQAHGLHDMPAVRNGRVFACDGNRYFSRPGPRLIYSSALIARAAYWDEVPALPEAIESGISQVLVPAGGG